MRRFKSRRHDVDCGIDRACHNRLAIRLTLPAVQMARESARQTECENNLHQLALTAQLHANANGYFQRADGNSSSSALFGGITCAYTTVAKKIDDRRCLT